MNAVKYDPQYYEKDPLKKNRAWGTHIITLLRMEHSDIVDKQRASKGMKYLMSKQDMEVLKKEFKRSADFVKDTEWLPIAVFERIRNILIAEYVKGAYGPEVKAVDPSAEDERKADRDKLLNRRKLEVAMNTLRQRTNDAPYKYGKEKYSGNVEEFDQMGLDSGSTADVDFFYKMFYKLGHEIMTKEVITALMRHNEFEVYAPYLVNDMLAKKAIAFQQFNSPQSGEIKWKYLTPETVKWTRGKRKDGKDSLSIGYETQVTIREFLEFAGPDFDFDRDSQIILQAIVHTNGPQNDWVSINREGVWGTEGEFRCSWQDLQQFKVLLGYIEFKSVDGTAQKKHKVTGIRLNMDYGDDIAPNSTYTKVVEETQKTYKSWYVGTGARSQYIFKFGKLYHTLTYGADDEYASYSINVLVEEGPTAVEIAMPFINLINEAFYKMLWGIWHSMPRKRIWNYEAIARLIKKIRPKGAAAANSLQGMMNEVIQAFGSSLYEMYSTPEEQKLGGDQRPHYWDEGGLDPIAIAMQTVLDWGEGQVSQRLGISPLREAYSPDPKDGYKLQMQSMEQSRNATHYIPTAIQYVLKNTSTGSLLMVQDAVELNCTATVDFLENLVGKDNIDSIRALKKIPLHRYAIHVDVSNSQARKQQVEMKTNEAYQRKEITSEQYFLLMDIDDWKRASQIMSYFTYMGVKRERDTATLLFQREQQTEQQKHLNIMEQINAKGTWDVRTEAEKGKYIVAAHQKDGEFKKLAKDLDIQSNAQKLTEKAQSQKMIDDNKANLKLQEAISTQTLS